MPSITSQPPLLLTDRERPRETRAPDATSTAMVVFQRAAGEGVQPDATRPALDANQQATVRELEQTVAAPHGMRLLEMLDCSSEPGAPAQPTGSHDKPKQVPPPKHVWHAAVSPPDKPPTAGNAAASERGVHTLAATRRPRGASPPGGASRATEDAGNTDRPAYNTSTLSRGEALAALGFGKGETPDQEAIKRAYRREALKHHPDRIPDTATKEQREAAEAKFKLATEANEVLTGKAAPRT